jgi:hypothetical protein
MSSISFRSNFGYLLKSSSPIFATNFFMSGKSPGEERCGAVRCGVVWCDVVRCGVVWCGVVRCGVVRCGAMRCGGGCGKRVNVSDE